MKILLLIGINTKYIHPNMAIRLLKKNSEIDCDFQEFLVKDDNEYIVQEILKNTYTMIGFSCYIWNIEKILELSLLLKKRNPAIKILLGGPEVSFDYQDIIRRVEIDYIIKDEGEESLNLLLKALKNREDISSVPNVVTKFFDNPIQKPDIKNIQSAYDIKLDYRNQIIYFETTRGCPFRCSYCLSSASCGVRFFEIEKIKADLKYLLEQGTRTIKFLDRNFTTNKENALEIIQFLEQHKNPESNFQFEINLDLLSRNYLEEIDRIISPGFFRFEVGIQSLNSVSNLLVDRKQDNAILLKNLIYLREKNKIDVHADLIFGLPMDTLKEFKETFNAVLKTKPKELQLGFLKFLKGTKIRNEFQKYHYQFDEKAPYEIKASSTFNEADLNYAKIAENALDHYYNKNILPKTMNLIIDSEENLFQFFYDLGIYFNSRFENTDKQFIRYFEIFIQFLSAYPHFKQLYPLILMDYYNHYTVKPKILGDPFDKKLKNQYLRKLFERNYSRLSLDEYFKYANIISIDSEYCLFYYYRDQKKIIDIIPIESII